MSTLSGDAGTPSSFQRVLSEAECYELLAVATVARIAFASPTGIKVLPVNYRLGDGRRLFVNTAAHGTICRLAGANSPAAFEVDYHATDFTRAWSVLMNGALALLDAAASTAYGQLRLPPVPWPDLGSSITIQFVPETISGRHLSRH